MLLNVRPLNHYPKFTLIVINIIAIIIIMESSVDTPNRYQTLYAFYLNQFIHMLTQLCCNPIKAMKSHIKNANIHPFMYFMVKSLCRILI